MNYTIDSNNPLYAIVSPVMDALTQKDNAIATLQSSAESLTAQLQQSQAAGQTITTQLASANATVQALQTQLQQTQAQLPQPWQVTADKIIAGGLALGKFNIPYFFGGDTFAEGGIDCSGFTKLLYDLHAGTNLHRVSGDQASQGTAVDPTLDKLRPGDLLFFTYSQRNGGKPTHVGIYVGDGKMLHTNNDQERIHTSDVDLSTVTAARRMF